MTIKKRGQITIFIIVGIVMLALTLGIIYLVNTLTKEKLPPPEIIEVQPVKDYVENCLEEQLKEIVYFDSLQGGYFGIPDYPLENNVLGPNVIINIPYYLYYSQMTEINESQLEEEISLGMLSTIDECTNFSMFPYNISVDKEKINFSTSISPSSIIVYAYLPILVKVGEATSEINKFLIKTPSNLYKLHKAAVNISYEQYDKGNELCLTCLSELINKSELQLNLVEIEGKDSYVIIYTISDIDSDLIFNFAHQFNLSAIPTPLYIERIDELEAIIGSELYYVVNATGENLTFSDNTDLFDIDPFTGLIQFTPNQEDVGSHLVIINVEDTEGNRDEEIITLHITKDEENLPQIEDMPSFVANVSEPFSYMVKASSPLGLEINFTEDSDLFKIDSKTGVIEFTPQETDFGVQDFTVTVTDEQGNQNTKEVSLTIQ